MKREIKNFILKYIPFVKTIVVYSRVKSQYSLPKFGFQSATAKIGYPIIVTNPKNVILQDNCIINSGAKIINVESKFIVKKNTSIAYGLTAVTGNHVPTVGVPQATNNQIHKNEKEKDLVIEEDCWIGANVTLLYGAHIGRGAVVGASSLVNKYVPPYSVVVGTPAKIVAVKFSIDQILKHEAILYKEDERMSKKDLEVLFNEYYCDKKIIGVDDIK